jgi:DNA-binding NtrC family response regulator
MKSTIQNTGPDSNHRVLIFDDDNDLLEVCTIILRTKNFDVIAKNKCTELIHDVENYMPDVILMDNWIPDTGGVKATQLIKENNQLKNIPVIFFSANSDIAHLCSEAGADYFLQKPFDVTELEEIVTTAIHNRILQ